MKTLEIVKGENNAILRTKSTEVRKFDAGLRKFAKQMKSAMEKANGVGIAAPQVGENVRAAIVVLDVKTVREKAIVVVNPVIVWHGEETEIDEEGCLSLPGMWGKVERWKDVRVEFCDLEGARHSLTLNGMNARVVQHEIDHLDGVLFIDRLVKE